MSLSTKRQRSPKKQGAPTPWMSECPVQEDDPDIEGLGDEALIPGPALVKCSGKDIHLQKAAANKKGDKYLCILPGLMSFHAGNKKNNSSKGNNDTESASEPALSLTQDTIESSTTEVVGNEHDEKKEDGSNTATQSIPAKQRFAENWVSLGHIDHLHSEQPTLSLPLPNQQALELSGKKVATTTKFLVLSIHPRKGKVTCKHIFDSALVFGNATLITDPNQSGQDDDDNSDDIIVEEISETDKNHHHPIQHYGSSSRPLGDDQTAFSSSVAPHAITKADMAPSSMRASRTLSQNSQTMDDGDRHSSSSEEMEEASSGSEDEFKLKNIDSGVSSNLPKRRTSRRESRKSIKYNEEEEEDSPSSSSSDGEENDSDEDEGKEKPPTKEAPPRSRSKPPPKRTQSDSAASSKPSATSRKRKSKTPPKVDPVFQDSSDEDVPSNVFSDSDHSEPLLTQDSSAFKKGPALSRSGRRSSTKPINYNEDKEEGNSDEVGSDTEQSGAEDTAPKRQRRAPKATTSSSRSLQAKQSAKENKKEGPSGFTDSSDSESDPKSDAKKRGRTPSSSKQGDVESKSPKPRRSSATDKKSQSSSRSKKADSKLSSQTPSPRRRKKGGLKRSPAKKIIELDDDGEFKFL